MSDADERYEDTMNFIYDPFYNYDWREVTEDYNDAEREDW